MKPTEEELHAAASQPDTVQPDTTQPDTVQPGTVQSHDAPKAAPSADSVVQLPAQEHPKQEHWTVDGLEETPAGTVARLEQPNGQTRDIPLSQLPAGLREGDWLAVQESPAGLQAQILSQETAHKQQHAQAKLEALNTAGTQARLASSPDDGAKNEKITGQATRIDSSTGEITL